MGNAAAEPLCTGDLVGVEELCKERTVNDLLAWTVSDIADDHGGFSLSLVIISLRAMNPSMKKRTFIVRCTHLSMVIRP